LILLYKIFLLFSQIFLRITYDSWKNSDYSLLSLWKDFLSEERRIYCELRKKFNLLHRWNTSLKF
jgi:hypothetical protein